MTIGEARASAEREAQELRSFVEWVAGQLFDGYALDGFDLWDEMIRRGLLVEVPATEEFMEEWGEGTAMYNLRWSESAKPEPIP